jgi:hypothetical protein
MGPTLGKSNVPGLGALKAGTPANVSSAATNISPASPIRLVLYLFSLTFIEDLLDRALALAPLRGLVG